MLKDLKYMAARHFSGEFRNVDSYTTDELSRAKQAITDLGYKAAPEGAYPDEDKFGNVLFDYTKENENGERTGTVTFFLDKGNKSRHVEDGIMSIAYDYDLIKKAGSITTIHSFALKMNPTKAQKAIMASLPFLKP